MSFIVSVGTGLLEHIRQKEFLETFLKDYGKQYPGQALNKDEFNDIVYQVMGSRTSKCVHYHDKSSMCRCACACICTEIRS